MSNKHYIIPIFVPHLGCPHNCVFCNQNKISGEEQEVTLEQARKIIEEHLSTIEYKDATIEISFFGGTFTAVPLDYQKALLSIAKEYKDRGDIKYIRLSTRPDYIDEEILKHLKFYEVDIIELGVQSLDDEVLRLSGRGHNSADVEAASKLIKEFGFVLGHQIMLGLPGDTLEKDIETAVKSIEMKPDLCRIYPALVIKETPMEEMLANGTYKPYTLDEAVEIAMNIYQMYKDNNINVIRMGLQPTDNINEGRDIIEGPFHPAFRELVEGRLITSQIYKVLSKEKGDYFLTLNERTLSKLYANKKQYFNSLKKELMCNIQVKIDNSVPFNNIKINTNINCINISI